MKKNKLVAFALATSLALSGTGQVPKIPTCEPMSFS